MPASLSEIARACGVSTATVSRALAKHPYVRPELRSRIEAQAARLGYAQNRLVGALMGHVRRGRTQRFIGNLAIVHVPAVPNPKIGVQERKILESAMRRAEEQGFSMDLFELTPGPRGEAGLARMLKARGIRGIIFVYPQPRDCPNHFPWEEFSLVAIDLARPEPLLNTVWHDHYVSVTSALLRLRAAGYKRAGLFLEDFKNSRTNYKWSSAFETFQSRRGGIGDIPLLIEERMTEKSFAKWYRTYRPDLVIGHFEDSIRWLKHLGKSVPSDVGFFCLNSLSCARPCAGIDPHLEEQGKAAADLLMAEVQRGEQGLPAVPRQILIPGRVVSGPTVRELSEAH